MANLNNSRASPEFGRRLLGLLLCGFAVYVIGSYVYWPVLKLVGTLVLSDFHFEDRVVIVHGDAPFWSVLLFSPVTFLYHFLESLPPRPTVEFVSEYRRYPYPPHALLIVGSSVLIAFGAATCLVWFSLFLLRRIGVLPIVKTPKRSG